VPELGGTVGYELNLFLQDYIGKTGTLWFWFWSDHLRYFLNLNSPERIQSFFENTKKEIKTDLGTNSGTGGSNLEEFAITDEKEVIHPHIPKPSKYEVDKEALKPTISHSSEINLDPVSKAKPVEEILTDKNAVDDSFVIETAPEEDLIEENLASRLVSDFGLFDPIYPTINTQHLLKEYSTGGITINQEELEENKTEL
jgi:S-DNA-T family DNA segregation ATPase FtsK/SpoIIIE